MRRGIARSRLTCCKLVAIFEHRLAAKGRKLTETAIAAGFFGSPLNYWHTWQTRGPRLRYNNGTYPRSIDLGWYLPWQA